MARTLYAPAKVLLSGIGDGSAGNPTTSAAEAMPSAQDISVFIEYAAGTTGGAIVVESGPTSGYTGTWFVEGNSAPPNPNAAGSEDRILIKGPIEFLRVRATSGMSGGATPGFTARVQAVGQY
jgi:hypothetical protein